MVDSPASLCNHRAVVVANNITTQRTLSTNLVKPCKHANRITNQINDILVAEFNGAVNALSCDWIKATEISYDFMKLKIMRVEMRNSKTYKHRYCIGRVPGNNRCCLGWRLRRFGPIAPGGA